MDPRLLDYYNTELRHLRETAAEFAREYPKIAGRLALDKDGKEVCPDPYVERLLEGFAYLAARVHLKLDAEFPRFTQSLLETIYPHFLSPIPSMAVVHFAPEEQEAGLAEGPVIPRGTLLRSMLAKGNRTVCTFKTAHDVSLFPLRIVEARYYTRDTVELGLPPDREVEGRRREPLKARAALRIRLQTTAGLTFKQLNLDNISFFLRGAAEDARPSFLYEQVFSRKLALVVQTGDGRKKNLAVLPSSHIRRVGFDSNQSLLPSSARSFEGYRLLREYYAFPQRFLFFELAGLRQVVKQCDGNTLDLVVVLKEQEVRLEGKVDASCFELFCTPVINLFSKTLDRISLSDRFSEFHVIPDKTRPLDFEVFEIENVTGYGTVAGEEQGFAPFYEAKDTDLTSAAFYTVNRVKRMLTAREKQFGGKVAYPGTDVFLSLVDAKAAPYRPNLKELGVRALCTNRHLPLFMAIGVGQADFTMELSAPVTSIRCLSGPTDPLPSFAEGDLSWRIISHLSLNYLSLVDVGKDGAAALRDLLKLYVQSGDQSLQRQIEGVLSTKCVPIIRRIQTPGPIAFARGLQITVEFDERAFVGTGVFTLGAVLGEFFAKHVSINSFTETVIRSEERGEIMRWPPQVGTRQTI